MKRVAAIALLIVSPSISADTAEIVRRATEAMKSDWKAAPDWAFMQRDESASGTRTHHVLMIGDSDYYMLAAIDDKPVSGDQRAAELQKLKREADRRSHETPEEKRRRADNYRKQRQQNGDLLLEFPNAFQFEQMGEETVGGRDCYVLEAVPKTDYQPPNRTARVLTGMEGRLWIEKEGFHWTKAEANVVHAVSIFGFFARVLPETRMKLEMRPVSDSVWQMSRFDKDLRISKFWSKSTQSTRSSFSDYRPNEEVLRDLLAQAPQ
jgi:hypothetical protein